MLADDNVHGAVLKSRYTSRFCKDVDPRNRAPVHLDEVARLLFNDSGIGPVLKIAEYLGVVLGHLNHLILGLLKVPTECRSKESGGVAEELLVHVEYLSVRPDFDLDDRIERVPVRKSEKERAIFTVSQGPTYRLGLYVSIESDVMLSANIIKCS